MSDQAVKDPSKHAPQSFSWGRLIVEMRLTGFAAMIACHCEPVHYNAEMPFLRVEVPEALEGLRESASMKQFRSSLKDYFGESLELELVSGPALKSPASLSAAKKVGSMTAAHALLMKDEFVQKMIADFGAKIFIESITTGAPAASKKPG